MSESYAFDSQYQCQPAAAANLERLGYLRERLARSAKAALYATQLHARGGDNRLRAISAYRRPLLSQDLMHEPHPSRQTARVFQASPQLSLHSKRGQPARLGTRYTCAASID